MGQVFGAAASAIIVLVVTFVAARLRPKPNPIRGTARLRLPKMILYVGGLLIAIGTLMILIAFMDPPQGDAVAMRLTSIAMLVAGGLFMVGYFMYFMEIAGGRVVTRGLSGTIKTVPFDRIARYQMTKDSNGKDVLRLEGVDGTKINIHVSMFDASPLLNYLERREARAAWGAPAQGRPPMGYRESSPPGPTGFGTGGLSQGSPSMGRTQSGTGSRDNKPRGNNSRGNSPRGSATPWQGSSAWGDGKDNSNNGPFHKR